MAKRERFMNLLGNNPVDRVPVAFFHHFCSSNERSRGMENQETFERNIIGHKLAREKFDPDVTKIINDTLVIMSVDISSIKTLNDLHKAQVSASDSASIVKSLELIKRARIFYEDSDAPVYAAGFPPPIVLRDDLYIGDIPGESDEFRMLKFTGEAPDAVVAAIKNLCDGISVINEMLIREGGVDGTYMDVGNQSNFFSDDFYCTYVAPYEKEVVKSANKLSKINLLRTCGYRSRANHLGLSTDFEAAVVNTVVYVEGVSLSRGKKLFGGRLVFGGFTQDIVTYKGTEQKVKEATWETLDKCGQIGIMLGVDCTIPNNIDDSRPEWVCQVAIKYAAR